MRPTTHKKQIKKKLPVEILTPEEAQRLLKATPKRAPTGIRNRALLVLGYRAGLRLSEALALYLKDVDTKKGAIRILHGKGDKSRTVGIDSGTCAILDKWIETRQKRGFKASQPLFCTLEGESIKQAYIRALMKRLAQKAGIEKRVHFHGLRHTFAWELVEEGMRVTQIQKILGHSSLQVTSIYLNHINPQELIQSMKDREWNLE